MKKYVLILCIAIATLGCKKTRENQQQPQSQEKANIAGHWDNFQQYWLENTETDLHRVETNDKHRHLSLMIEEGNENEVNIEVREGRNGKLLVEKMIVTNNELNTTLKQNGDTIYLSGMKHFKNSKPYKFIRTRKFSGWIEYPIPQYRDSVYRRSNLEIHDQGGMATLNLEGVDYTVELTQLVFGKKIKIMKIAVYDMPLDSVGINSRSISYTWTSPESKRLGINLRKVVSGWTLIEPGYINSDNTKFKKK